jgi:hypothetical protein
MTSPAVIAKKGEESTMYYIDPHEFFPGRRI